MNIVGNGVDIVNNMRIKRSIKNKNFITRVFTKNDVNKVRYARKKKAQN